MEQLHTIWNIKKTYIVKVGILKYSVQGVKCKEKMTRT